ncbi:hypothetical protein PFY12_03245 [Chryseobacterium camelliae]|uniref:Uncharacterized protein n=1 Tax=Chryseobacterium camelliae TaxID=1265445 RepID=A0ABY7QN79_9FLAO|nr:hypothetical protein [Chryseobacterium camelliae]WBV61141.1 hypothetical protein PFY12_03245 [Chryseobacterium camelliae]
MNFLQQDFLSPQYISSGVKENAGAKGATLNGTIIFMMQIY